MNRQHIASGVSILIDLEHFDLNVFFFQSADERDYQQRTVCGCWSLWGRRGFVRIADFLTRLTAVTTY
jgi:hypothetical protein